MKEEFNKWLSEFDLDGAELHGEDDGRDGGGDNGSDGRGGEAEATGDNQEAGAGGA